MPYILLIVILAAGIFLILISFFDDSYSTESPIYIGSLATTFGSIGLLTLWITGSAAIAFLTALILCVPILLGCIKLLKYMMNQDEIFSQEVTKIIGAEGVLTESRRLPRSGKVTLDTQTIRGKSEIRVWHEGNLHIPKGSKVVVISSAIFNRIFIKPALNRDATETL